MEQITEHATELDDVALVAMVAVMLGLLFMRFRQPPMVGYILAGLLLGPTGLGLVAQSGSVLLLAELGVLILLFLIGMELSLRAFVTVVRPAVLIAGGQLLASFGVTAAFAAILDWSLAQTVLLAFVIAVSSTAVAIKILEEIGELRTETGRITVGVLIAQDMAIVPMPILTDSFGGADVSLVSLLLRITLAVGILVCLVWFLGRPGKINILGLDRLKEKPDILSLVALALCFSTSSASGILGLTPAYGAFIAGLVLANTTMRTELITVTQPIQSVLVFVFFLSIGLLLDVQFIMSNLLLVILFVFGVVILKTALNIVLINRVGFSFEVAIPAGLSMAQVGEFSFVLAAAGFSNGTIDFNAYRLAIAVIAISLIVSPFWMSAARRFHDTALQTATSFRVALAQTYPSELAELERGTAWTVRSAKKFAGYLMAFWMMVRRKPRDANPIAGLLPPPDPGKTPLDIANCGEHQDSEKPRKSK
ncbi:MAG: cation:proton antiporter [Fimbriimonadaceae bacterium]|nr:cation:proton antiporter [Alphaproteobacteria bacterium]